ncbi:uncharacterized protein LOC128668557 [Microplitis demolitor]|uniref:uncharacterized protein LOC128668557 n=1 Tax=Microplitis demolitor TaxID=69319 RepID=UPI00235B5CEB|nr:uncharacterized protein LOC128668557 [Microplitis demolitor]
MVEHSRLKRQRGHIQATITALKNAVDAAIADPEHRNIHFIQATLNTAVKAFEKFDIIQTELEEVAEDEIDNRMSYVSSFDVETSRARTLIQRLTPTPVNADNSQRAVASVTKPKAAVTLPTIPLPTFDGTVEKWSAFYNLFATLIDQEDLPPVKKLNYLRLSLTGKAASAIESLELTDDNYSVALDILKEKYESVRRVTRRHWSLLREYPKLQKDSAAAINQLVDTFYQHTRALENLKAPVSSWDIPLVDLILSKLNSTTIWHWELTLTDEKVPSYKNLLTFLEKRASCGDTSRYNETPSNPPPRKDNHQHRPFTQALHVTNNSNHHYTKFSNNKITDPAITCPVCNEHHLLYTCEKFRSLSIEDRRKVIKDTNRCYNCFGKGHSIKSCTSKASCQICSKRHNTLLHFQRDDNLTQTSNVNYATTSNETRA